MLIKSTYTMKCNTQLTTTSEPPPTVDAVGGTPEHLDCQNVLPMGGPLGDTINGFHTTCRLNRSYLAVIGHRLNGRGLLYSDSSTCLQHPGSQRDTHLSLCSIPCPSCQKKRESGDPSPSRSPLYHLESLHIQPGDDLERTAPSRKYTPYMDPGGGERVY
ncbi:unnamed protein product [Boreogadus saida]